LNWVILPATWLALVIGLFIPDRTFLFGPGFFHGYYPLEIYRFMQAEMASQNLFNEARYGGSMLWWLYPRFKPFVDGRGDAFTEEFWTNQYLPVVRNEPGSEEILKSYNVTGALLPIYEDHTIPPLATRLHADTNWALVAFNDETLLFLERTPTNAEVIRRYEFEHLWPVKWSFDALESPQTRSKASEEAQRAFELSPNSLFAQTALARACFVNEKFADAAAILGKFAAGEDASVNYLRDYGYALFRIGRFEEADQIFTRMLRRQLLPGFAWYMRYVIAAQRGNTAQAQDFLAKAIKAEPTNPEYQRALKHLSGV
jgi:pentatricopeptide repeat protein